MFFYHFKLELAQLLRFNYLSTSYLFKRLFLRSLQPLYDLFYLSSYFSNSSYFHWNSLSFGSDLSGIHWSLSFSISAGIFPLHLNDFESTNVLKMYLSLFVLTKLPISEPVKAFPIFQKSDETQWNYVWHPGASHVRT